MDINVIILAGGLGTRLRKLVSDVPKCMAPVNGIPFIEYLLTYLEENNVTNIIFSVGHLSGIVIDYIESRKNMFTYDFSIETEPLGTGGGVKLALDKIEKENVLVLNGDTLFKINIRQLLDKHIASQADCTLSLKKLRDFNRYGSVKIGPNDRIEKFIEKTHVSEGLINGGVTVLSKRPFLERMHENKFSFESDFLESHTSSLVMKGLVFDEYFIDIGVEEDYHRANNELGQIMNM